MYYWQSKNVDIYIICYWLCYNGVDLLIVRKTLVP